MSEQASQTSDLRSSTLLEIKQEDFVKQCELLKKKLPEDKTMQEYYDSASGNWLWVVATLEFIGDGKKISDFYQEMKKAGAEKLDINPDRIEEKELIEKIWNSMVVVAEAGQPSLAAWAKQRLEQENQLSEPEPEEVEEESVLPGRDLFPDPPPKEEKVALEIPEWLQNLKNDFYEKTGEKPEAPEPPAEPQQSEKEEGDDEEELPDWMAGLREQKPEQPEEKKEIPEIEIKMNENVAAWAKNAVTVVQMGNRVIIAPDKPELPSKYNADSGNENISKIGTITVGKKEVNVKLIDEGSGHPGFPGETQTMSLRFELNLGWRETAKKSAEFITQLNGSNFEHLLPKWVTNEEGKLEMMFGRDKYVILPTQSGDIVVTRLVTTRSDVTAGNYKEIFKNLCEITTVVVNKWLGLTEGEAAQELPPAKPEEEKKPEVPEDW